MAKHLTLPKIGGESESQNYKTKLIGEGPELLDYYIKAYKEEYSQDVNSGDMIAHIVMTYLSKDRKFRSYVKSQRSAQG